MYGLSTRDTSESNWLGEQHSSIALLNEYCVLAKRTDLEEGRVERMIEILEIAQSDHFLNSLICEADILIAEEMGFNNPDNLHKFSNELSRLREHLDIDLSR